MLKVCSTYPVKLTWYTWAVPLQSSAVSW